MDDTEFTLKGLSNADLKATLLNQRHQQQYCDVTLLAGSQEIPAHRCVLAGVSSYFSNLFLENDEETVNLSQTGIETDILRVVVDFMYGCQITITETNITDILASARLFCLDELEAICKKFLFCNLRIRNCLQSWLIAVKYEFEDLCNIARSHAMARFHDALIDYNEVLKIDPNNMCLLLSDGLGKFCTNEKKKFFLHKYISYDIKNRETYGERLMDSINKEKSQNMKADMQPKMTGEIMLWKVNKQHVVYNVNNDAYLKVPNLDKLSGDWSVDLLGIGEHYENALIKISNYFGSSRKLFNIFTQEISDIPIVPAKGTESVSKSYSREQEIFGTYNGTLFCVFKSTMVMDKGAMFMSCKGQPAPLADSDEEDDNENLNLIVTGVFVQRFDSKKGKWKLLETVYQKEVKNVKIYCVFRASPESFILVQSSQVIETFSVDLEKYEVNQLASLHVDSQQEEEFFAYHTYYSLEVVGDSNGLTLKIQHSVYRYIIGRNKWEKTEEITANLYSAYLALSNSNGIIFQKESSQNMPLRVLSVNIFTTEKKELCPPPCLKSERGYNDSAPIITNVPLCLLERFETVSMMDVVNVKLIEEWRVQDFIRSFLPGAISNLFAS